MTLPLRRGKQDSYHWLEHHHQSILRLPHSFHHRQIRLHIDSVFSCCTLLVPLRWKIFPLHSQCMACYSWSQHSSDHRWRGLLHLQSRLRYRKRPSIHTPFLPSLAGQNLRYHYTRLAHDHHPHNQLSPLLQLQPVDCHPRRIQRTYRRHHLLLVHVVPPKLSTPFLAEGGHFPAP